MRLTLLLCTLAGLCTILLTLRAQDRQEKKPDDKTFGLETRVPWTTSKVKGSPEPPPPFRTEVAFPKVKFNEPLDLTYLPGSDRLLVAERYGKIFSFLPEKSDLVIDLKRVVYALTVHPQFAKNGYLYVTSIPDPSKSTPTGSRVSRFTVKGEPPTADLKSEKVILEWPSGGHNGGCLKFGPDGFLYIGTGDGSGIADERHTGQDITDLLASILRIDVDGAEDDKGYAVPKDNPFVDRKGARPEIWAYGIRQPWKFSFDRKSGELWCGEVGQDLWESVYRIEKGGNYGWSVMEGSHPFRPERDKGPTPILKPVVEHPHSDFRSLTGGFVYRGKRLKDLEGAYLYGDFDTGRIWSLRYDGKTVSDHKELTKTTLRIVSFGEDRDGEVYFLDFVGGQLHRLVPSPPSTANADFPKKLSDTGLFASTKDHKPALGLIPYSVNAQLWSDGAVKDRFLAIPGAGKIEYNAITYPQPAPGAPPGWRFPDGTVVVKTFALDLEAGNPKSRRRLETRLLHYEAIVGTDEYGEGYWRGYTYVWNDEQTDAILADASGLDRTFVIKDAKAPGGERKQTYHFPGRNECVLCHTQPAKFVLGVNTLQMNKDHDYGNGRVANQLSTLEHIGLFAKPIPKPEKEPRLADYDDAKEPLDSRARAYLHANCSHCHMKWGGGNADFQMLATLPFKEMRTDLKPNQGNFDLKDPRVIVPGEPERSVALHRMNLTGLGRMPHVASSVVDEKGVKIIHDWIKELPKE
jgi:uncharacterized repeat protein (TIGR03806 family)